MANNPESPGTRIAERIRMAWQDDPSLHVEATLRPDGLHDLCVVSDRFAGRSASDREMLLWEVLRDADRADLLQMTYGLLLTHEEAEAYQTGHGSSD